MSSAMNMALDEEEISKRKEKAKNMSELADKAIPEAEKLAKAGKLADAIELLLSNEKQTRQGGDVTSTSRLAVCIVNLCFEAKKYETLNENLVLLSKRRGQLKTTVQKTVQAAMEFIEKLKDKTKMDLIDTLIKITEGKIYVEVERARLTRILADIKEKEGDVAGAAETMRAVQVETFGAMEKKEKTDFILEQVRLCLDADDYVRAQILSNKINRKYLLKEEMQEYKLRFYQLMTRFHGKNEEFLDIARCYQSIYNTPTIKEDDEKRAAAIKDLALFAVLAPYDSEQSDLLARVADDSFLAEVPSHFNLVAFFRATELMRWPRVQELYTEELSDVKGFEKDGSLWKIFHRRVIEHNVRTIARYYERIALGRLASLLDLSVDDAEKHVSELVVAKSIYARIDRPAGIVSFQRRRSPNELLNDWSNNLDKLLELVESTTHLIAKERMTHGVE